MFSSENNVGRLVELRIVSPVTVAEIAELQRVHLGVLARVGGEFVIVTDLRGATVFPQEISQRFIALMSHLNPLLLRSGILINESAILGLQAERAIEEAGNPHRRAFREAGDLEAWMAEVLDDEEKTRLQAFLNGHSE